MRELVQVFPSVGLSGESVEMLSFIKYLTIVSSAFAFGWLAFAVLYILGVNYYILGVSTLVAHFVFMIIFTVVIGLIRPAEVKE